MCELITTIHVVKIIKMQAIEQGNKKEKTKMLNTMKQ